MSSLDLVRVRFDGATRGQAAPRRPARGGRRYGITTTLGSLLLLALGLRR